MRILCVSDQVDPLVYSPRMRERYKDVDLVLSAGDLPPEYLGFITSMLNKDLVYVAGNHDLGELEAQGHRPLDRGRRRRATRSTGAVDAGFKIKRAEGLIILGLPGSMLYNKGRNQYSELAMSLRLALLAPRLLLNKLLLRAGPWTSSSRTPRRRGIHDRDDLCHRGFKCFLWLMRVFKPRWLVHGHIHLYDLADVRISTYLETTRHQRLRPLDPGHGGIGMGGWFENMAEEDFARARTRELLSRISRLLDPESEKPPALRGSQGDTAPGQRDLRRAWRR